MEQNKSRLKNVWNSNFDAKCFAGWSSYFSQVGIITSASGFAALPQRALAVYGAFAAAFAGVAAWKDRHREEGTLHSLKNAFSESFLGDGVVLTTLGLSAAAYTATHHDPKHALFDFGLAALAQAPRATRAIQGAFRRHREAALSDPAQREYFHDDGGPFFL
jgi:hypothetical protein